MTDSQIAVVILCGGQSKRMGGGDKAHQMLAGQTLLQHVINRVIPQVGQAVLSVEKPTDRFAAYGFDQIADPVPGHNGPLGGLVSALRAVAENNEWLLLVPCDAPFLPEDLAFRLHQCADELGTAGCIASYRGQVQPTFSIWNRSLLTSLENAVSVHGMGGFKQYLDRHPQALLEWEESDISPFFNINDSAALALAERLISSSVT